MLISSASIPAAPANLTDSPSRQEQPKFNSQTFLYTISCPGLILAMAAIPVILNLQAGTAGLNLGSIGSMESGVIQAHSLSSFLIHKLSCVGSKMILLRGYGSKVGEVLLRCKWGKLN